MFSITKYLILLLIIIVCLYTQIRFTRKKLNISVCVACYPPHLKKLNNLLDSISYASHHPNECIVRLSETTKQV